MCDDVLLDFAICPIAPPNRYLNELVKVFNAGNHGTSVVTLSEMFFKLQLGNLTRLLSPFLLLLGPHFLLKQPDLLIRIDRARDTRHL